MSVGETARHGNARVRRMYLHRDELKWTARAPAKLNLYLEVNRKRSDGFHDLQTVMVPIRLSDDLTLVVKTPPSHGSSGEISLHVSDCRVGSQSRLGPQLPAATENLVVRALRLLQQRSGTPLGADVRLAKRIPLAAGLGGGSSDAAAALRIANRAWRLGWTTGRLVELAGEIGSDVPFFIIGRPALCHGRGERVQSLPAARTLHFVVVKPPCELRTADVYRTYDALRVAHSSELRPGSHPLLSGDGRLWDDQPRWLHNGLQAAAARLSPWIGRMKELFQRFDFLAHQLSGSGSAYFGVCRHAQHARRLATILRALQIGIVYATRSC